MSAVAASSKHLHIEVDFVLKLGHTYNSNCGSNHRPI